MNTDQTSSMRKAIQRAGGTERALADEIGVSRGMVGHWKRGDQPIRPTMAIEIERATGVSAERLAPVLAEWLKMRGDTGG